MTEEENQEDNQENNEQQEEQGNEDDNQESNMLEEAKKVSQEIREGLAERAKLIEREEKILKRKEMMKELGGGSKAGTGNERKKEETPQEYVKRLMGN